MNAIKNNKKKKCQGLTLIEMTLVLAIMLSLTMVIYYSLGGMDKWKMAKAASEDLRVVYMAQKTFMADNPTNSVSALTATDLIPYLPNGLAAIPTIEKLDGSSVGITLTVMPPVVAGPYDPSANTDDGLWDVGKP